MDGITPDCNTERGCLIPKLTDQGQRAIEIRSLLIRLHNLVDSGSVLRMVDADLDDLKLLAHIEDELKASEPQEDNHGEGRQISD